MKTIKLNKLDQKVKIETYGCIINIHTDLEDDGVHGRTHIAIHADQEVGEEWHLIGFPDHPYDLAVRVVEGKAPETKVVPFADGTAEHQPVEGRTRFIHFIRVHIYGKSNASDVFAAKKQAEGSRYPYLSFDRERHDLSGATLARLLKLTTNPQYQSKVYTEAGRTIIEIGNEERRAKYHPA